MMRRDPFLRATLELALFYAGEREVRVEESTITVGRHSIALEPLRAEWGDLDQRGRNRFLARALRAAVTKTEPPFELDPARLRAAVRSRSVYETAALYWRHQLPDADPAQTHIPHRPIAADLAWVLVWDDPETGAIVNADSLRRWGLSFEEGLELGRHLVESVEFAGWSDLGGGVFQPNGDHFASSIPFVPELTDRAPIAGDLAVFAPTRDQTFVASAHAPDAVERAARLALDTALGAGAVSLTPVVGSGDHWHSLMVETMHPAYDELRELATRCAIMTYGEQEVVLAASLPASMNISSLDAQASKTGVISSLATWPEGTNEVRQLLLPISNDIAFVTGNGERIVIGWDTAFGIIGHRMVPTDHYPARYLISSFPTSVELTAMVEEPQAA